MRGPHRPWIPPGAPFRYAFQTIKHLQGFLCVPIFAAKIRFYRTCKQLFINSLNLYNYE